MTKKRYAPLIAGMTLAMSLLLPSQANAEPTAHRVTVPSVVVQADPVAYRTCIAGGFEGNLRFSYRSSSGKVYYVGKIEYRIYKGSNSGGNHANVSWYDEATGVEYYTADGIQDGQWHTLGGNYYRSHRDGVSFMFVFDKSLASDPQCNGWFAM